MEHLLTWLILIPILGALVVLFMPRQKPGAIRAASMGFLFVELALSLALLSADYTTGGYQFLEQAVWIESLGISYKVGVDGISLWLVLLTTALTPIALFVSWTGIDTKIKEYALSFLLLETGMLGAFVALDLFLFYVFWELMLVPMYLIIGVWGGPQRVYAAVKFFLYTMVGSLLMLVAILYLVASYKELAGVYSFDLADLTRVVLPYGTQLWMFAAFALAFAIKVPMFPFHTWLPDAHVQAPTGGSVILAAVLLKLGIYGFLRFAMPLFPLAAHFVGPTIAGVAIVGIIYGAWCAWVQRDVKKLVAYSSVSHMGFIMLGLFAMTEHGVAGSILQMINHGVSTGALFMLVGVIYERRHTRDLDDFGGLAKVMPWYAVIFVIVTMSSIGLPGTNGFVGEFMILSGTFVSQALQPWPRVFTLLAATGVIFAAIYMLHAVLKIFWGPVTHEANRDLPDISVREVLPLAPLLLLVFWIGLYPKTFLDPMEPAIDQFIVNFEGKKQRSVRAREPELLPPGRFGRRHAAAEGAADRAPEDAAARMALRARGGEQ
ncbi:MAG: complex I subunit 4 family protein [Myxococcota bacterium]